MPLFENPANFSKSRLKSDLIAHNVSLPPAKSKKEVYLELHLKHIGQKTATDFCTDEEDQVQDMPVSWAAALRFPKSCVGKDASLGVNNGGRF